MEHPFFSIVIPTLNEEAFLPKLLNDLKKQREQDFEIIIVDGQSEDKTKIEAEKFKRDFPFVFYEVDKKNVSYQRNYGASKAKGKYLLFLDADCRIQSDFIRKSKKQINMKKGLLFIPALSPNESSVQTEWLFQVLNFLIEISQSTNRPFSSGGFMICEANIFKIIGGFNEKLFIAEDHNLIQEAYKWGIRAKFLSNVKIGFSLRRMEKEGQMKLLYKYLLASTHILVKGQIKHKIFDYEMGGQLYQKSIHKKS